MLAVGETGVGRAPAAPASRVVVLAVGGALVASLALALAGMALGWLVLALLAAAGARGRTLRGAVAALPSAAVLLLGVASGLVLVTGIPGLSVLEAAPASRIVLVLTACLVTVPSLLRGARAEDAPRDEPSLPAVATALAALPAAVMTAVGLALVVLPVERAAGWFLSGDHVRHLALVVRTVAGGTLEYSSQTYPRAWHAVLGAMWVASGAERDPAGLLALVRLEAATAWVVLTLVALALAVTAGLLARRARLSGAVAGVAGLLAGGLVMGPPFFGAHVPRGFETSLLGLLLVAAAVLELVRAPRARWTLATAVAATSVLGHVWQVLLPVGAVLVLLALLARRPWRRRAAAVTDVGLVLLGAALAVPGLAGVVRGYGLGAAAEAGDVPPPALLWLALGIAAGAGLAVAGLRGPELLAPVASVLTTAAVGVGLALWAGVGLASYYPNKTLWTAAALGLPLLAVALVRLGAAADRPRGAVGSVLVVVGGCVVTVVLLVCLATPVLGVAGAWSAADARAVLAAAASPSAPDASVAWAVGSETDDATTQLLLDFYTADASTPPLGLAPREVAEQCAVLTADDAPLVLTAGTEAEVRTRFACATDLRVVVLRAEGGS